MKSYVRQLLTEMPGRLRPREVLRALLSGVSRKPGNGTPSGGLRRFSMKKIRKQTNQQTRKRMWHGDGERTYLDRKKHRESSQRRNPVANTGSGEKQDFW